MLFLYTRTSIGVLAHFFALWGPIRNGPLRACLRHPTCLYGALVGLLDLIDLPLLKQNENIIAGAKAAREMLIECRAASWWLLPVPSGWMEWSGGPMLQDSNFLL